MKKLNRKGFTLVELLAVIVILAIVVGIALTTILPTLKNSRQKAFDLTANTAAEFLEKQYQLQLIDEDITIESVPVDVFEPMSDDDYTKAGLKHSNYESGQWKFDTSKNRACVELTRSTDGQYYDANDNNGVAKSDGCY